MAEFSFSAVGSLFSDRLLALPDSRPERRGLDFTWQRDSELSGGKKKCKDFEHENLPTVIDCSRGK